MRLRNKYGNTRTVVDGISFQSRDEADYYLTLKAAQENGHIKSFQRQVRFNLHGGIKYIADFVIEELDGTTRVIDVKGYQTPEFKLKLKLFLADHGAITLVRAQRKAGIVAAWIDTTVEATP